jgi:hypothetical protein
MGATNVFSIGNGSITDFGKALTLASNITNISTAALANISNKQPNITHVAVATTPTPTHFYNSFQILHEEEDVIMEIACYPPKFICFDSRLFGNLSPYINDNIKKSLLHLTFFDSLFSSHLMKDILNLNDKIIDNYCPQLSHTFSMDNDEQ